YQVSRQALRRRIVRGKRSSDVEVVLDRLAKGTKGAIVHEGCLHGDVPKRGGAKGVPVGLVAGRVLTAEGLVCAGSVERVVRIARDELGYGENVVLEVAEHLVRLPGYRMAGDATSSAEEEQRPLLLLVCQGIRLAARKTVDGSSGESERELEL